jgi:hypothetical protein
MKAARALIMILALAGVSRRRTVHARGCAPGPSRSWKPPNPDSYQ